MHVVNMMFAKSAGGIEQCMVDHCRAAMEYGHRVTAITAPGAWANHLLERYGIASLHLRNMGKWDIFAARRLRHLLQGLKPDVIVAHGNRPLTLGCRAIKGVFPLVAVAHNYQVSAFGVADAAFATTRDLVEKVAQEGFARERIFHIPNMVDCGELPQRGRRNHPPIIGTLGRFVPKKGFHIYIEALKLLKSRGFAFRAILGGRGEEEARLKKLAQEAGLAEELSFPGWVEDKKAFYTGIDIFCLPSLHEPFGIVLLEAFAFGTPVVATDSEGPLDIITPGHDALMAEKNNAASLADALAALLIDESRAANMAANAFARVKTQYTLKAVGARLDDALLVVAKG